MTDIWAQLAANREATKTRPILDLFNATDRMSRFAVEHDGVLLDFSKTSADGTALDLLLKLAQQAGLQDRIHAMFDGTEINETEKRAVLHTALRAPVDSDIRVGGSNVVPEVQATLAAMERFAEALRSGEIRTSDGAPFTDVINIGIGGSDLGPAMATEALRPYVGKIRCHYVANVDGADIADTLQGLDPKRTLIVIVSKTFTTLETMTNAATAIAWLKDALGDQNGTHLAAISSDPKRTAAFGIADDRVFGFADWVGGRYSLWGPVGLSLMIAIGAENFRAFLAGGASMDAHFRDAPIAQNLPALLGLIGIWHSNICGYDSRALLPYDQRLDQFPSYVQQLDMESNGKGVALDGSELTRESGPIVWGAPGTNGQHAFFQLLHQGTRIAPCEFLIAAQGHEPHLAHQHRLLIANCLAQSEALMLGRSRETAHALAKARGHQGAELERMAAHLTFPGSRPSITIAYPKLTPYVLGQIIALYEHRVFTEGVIWGLNSFDQWGVELGKELATDLLPMVEGADSERKDASTRGLLSKLAKGADQ